MNKDNDNPKNHSARRSNTFLGDSKMSRVRKMAAHVKAVLNGKGEVYMSKGVGILMDVVIGALILFALYTLFKSYILPKTSGEVGTLFNTTPKINSADVTGSVSVAETAGN